MVRHSFDAVRFDTICMHWLRPWLSLIICTPSPGNRTKGQFGPAWPKHDSIFITAFSALSLLPCCCCCCCLEL